jgi:hypothetical protein
MPFYPPQTDILEAISGYTAKAGKVAEQLLEQL